MGLKQWRSHEHEMSVGRVGDDESARGRVQRCGARAERLGCARKSGRARPRVRRGADVLPGHGSWRA